MLVVVLLPPWTRPTSVVCVIRHVLCLMLESNVASTCDVWLPVSRLSMSMDELTCRVIVLYVLLAVLPGSHQDANPTHLPCVDIVHRAVKYQTTQRGDNFVTS